MRAPTEDRPVDHLAARTAPGRPPGRVRRLAGGLLLLLVVLLVVPTGASIARALAAPGTDSTTARLAEWARSHGMSHLVDALERRTYTPPRVGGPVAPDSPLATGTSTGTSRTPATATGAPSSAGLPAPPAVVPPVLHALPGEGTWRTVASVGGVPALREAFVRPDARHTSYTAGIAWMDPALVRFTLHPGTQEPGRRPGGRAWTTPPDVVGADRTGLLAAFNGGFRLDAAEGGFSADGTTVRSLRPGAASLVVTTDGRASVEAWGQRPGDTGPGGDPGPGVAAVRQNLDLLVDGGRVAPDLAVDGQGGVRSRWGATIGNRYYVWRSGVGTTADGALVYVAGDRLSAATLADLLVRAGAVRGMELDINPEWTTFVTYGPSGARGPGAAEADLLPDMQRAPDRYDTTSTRDFVAVTARTAPGAPGEPLVQGER